MPLFLAAAVFILCGPIFWIGVEAPGNEQPFHLTENSGLFQQVYPAIHYGFGRLARGEFPLWNDRQLCGTPFFADPRHALLQPQNLVFLFLETPRAMALHAFISLSLMGFFCVLFLRSLHLRYIPSVLGGMVYMCCGATAAAMSQLSCANALVWLPLLCCVIREYLRRPRAVLAVFGGTVTALLLLSGMPLLILSAFVLSFGYGLTVLFSGVSDNRARDSVAGFSRWERLRGLALMAILGLLLAGIQWVPALAWIRGLDAPLRFLTHFSVSGETPRSLRSLLAQLLEAHGDHRPALAYLGIAAVLLIPAALFHPISRGERVFLVLAAFGLPLTILAYTGDSPFSTLFLVSVYPSSFSAAVLTGLGADRLFAARRSARNPRLWGPLLLTGGVFILLFALAPGAARGRMLPCAAAILLFSLVRTSWAGVVSGCILVVFQFIDLNASTVNHQPHPFFTRGAGIAMGGKLSHLLRETALDDRVLVSTYPNNVHLHANIGMSDGFRMAGATGVPLTPEQRRWWEALEQSESLEGVATEPVRSGRQGGAQDSSKTLRGALLNVMAVRALAVTSDGVFSPEATREMQLRRRGGDANIQVYVNENVLPRLSWAHGWKIALEPQAALEALSAPDFDLRQECIIVPQDTALGRLIQVIPGQPSTPGGGPADRQPPSVLRFLRDEPEHIVVEVNNPTPGILLLGDTYDPGWRARVSGQSTPILRVNALFRGVALPPGDHVVTFDYQPRSFYAGALITFLTVLFLLVWGVQGLFRSRRAVRKLLLT